MAVKAHTGKKGAWTSKYREERGLGASLRAREVFPHRQCIAKQPTPTKPKNGLLLIIPFFFLSHPAPCEQKASLGWECGMLEIQGTGNLPRLPRLTLSRLLPSPIKPRVTRIDSLAVDPHPLALQTPPGATCVTFAAQTPLTAPVSRKPPCCPHPVPQHLRQQRHHRALSKPGNILLMGT